MKTLLQYQVDSIRADFARSSKRTDVPGVIEQATRPYYVEYGAIDRVAGTGRATCRCCGQKIAKGQDALRFAWDYTGCGSWTAVTSQIHFAACPAVDRRSNAFGQRLMPDRTEGEAEADER